MFDPTYLQTANDEILIAVQVETEMAIKNLEEILSVSGIDACYIGPSDLSCSLGFGVPPKWDDPRYLEVFDTVLKVAERHGKPVGMYATVDNIKWAIEKGFRLNTISHDDNFLIQGAQMALEKAREAVSHVQP